MIERMNGWGGLFVAGVLGALGMFYRHGSLIAGIQQKEKSQDETNKRIQDWMEKLSDQVGDVQLKLERWKPRDEKGGK